MKRNVEITGMSAVTPIGIGVAAFSDALKKGSSNFSIVNIELENQAFRFPIAKVEEFEFKSLVKGLDLPEYIQKKAMRLRNISRGAAFGVYSALDAWTQSNLNKSEIDLSRVAIVVCGNNFQRGHQMEIQEKYRQKLKHLNPSYGLNFLDTDLVGIISDLLHIRGEGYTIGAASASGNMGLIQGTRLVENGDYDVVIVVAPMMEMSIYEYIGFTEMGAMASLNDTIDVTNLCRPFDKKNAGFVFGENAACLILESEEHSKKRNVNSLGQIKGTGIVLDGNRNPDPSATGEAEAMQKALNNAGIKKEDISYINLHGSASPLGDRTEIEALLKVGFKKVLANSTKSLIGHGIVAAGLVEAVASIIQLNEGFVHKSNNLSEPISEEIKLTLEKKEDAELDWCITNSYGFGGINTSVVIKKTSK